MWCKHCRQDVPGIAVTDGAANMEEPRDVLDDLGLGSSITSLDAGAEPTERTPDPSSTTRFVCARCGEAVGSEPSQVEATAASGGGDAKRPHTADSFDTWQWELDQELHDARRLLASRIRGHSEHSEGLQYRFDSPAAETVPMQAQPVTVRSPRDVDNVPHDNSAIIFSWTVLSLGIMVFVCGGVLLAWSMVGGRADLWNLGLPITLGGQAVLLVGFLLLLERMWRDGRAASSKLNIVDDELDNLRQVATMMGQSQVPRPHNFYTHMAEGADPNLLLADLKGQLDTLSHKLAQGK